MIKHPDFNVDPYFVPGYWKRIPETYKLEAYRSNGESMRDLLRTVLDDRVNYNDAARNLLGVAYLDGRRPHLLMKRGTYRLLSIVPQTCRTRNLQHTAHKNLDIVPSFDLDFLTP